LIGDALRLTGATLHRLGVGDAQRLRILTFHSVMEHPKGEWHASPSIFARQMCYLRDAGYRTYSIKEIVEQWPQLAQRKEKAVALTFDDGLLSHCTVVCDILSSFKMRATFFLTTENINSKRSPPVSSGLHYFNDCLMLSWDDVRAMHRRGFEIGSHAHSHDLIAQMSEAVALENISTSKRLIERELNETITSFAYPYGHKSSYAEWTAKILKKVGFTVGCTQMGGALSPNDDLFELPRVGIRGNDSLEVFRQKVSGSYDFLRQVHRYFN
jgi:peptidoglycan/xylan/chitin deacetylase (PgdA/CDA1 family)